MIVLMRMMAINKIMSNQGITKGFLKLRKHKLEKYRSSMEICTRGDTEQVTEHGPYGGHKSLPRSGRADLCVCASLCVCTSVGITHSAFEGGVHVTQKGNRMGTSGD